MVDPWDSNLKCDRQQGPIRSCQSHHETIFPSIKMKFKVKVHVIPLFEWCSGELNL